MNKKVILVVIGLVLVFVGGWFWMKRPSGTQPKGTTTEEIFVSEAPEPTAEPEFKKEDFTIKILNGSGTPGLAGTLQTDLETAGFTVDSTGNADSYDFKNTVIRAKSTVPAGFVSLLKEELSSYGTIDTEELADDEDTDVVIVIGGKQKEAEPTAASDSKVTTKTPTPKTDSQSTPEAGT
ncbi:hypothetical protein A3F34_00260 [Candidatus Roizmanbacteria bacterium RIFCSPHIGHO2_12_FULL_44_10]|uniref:LytR/CpsA/Psr regulator C-terminal domain-containing protein n=1 Tax=Candidatus Roizmanbacteria bacterium RIFCSPHIGHO2_12_FULL_44_10 TaxID=1802054 RepID=A0A1F7I6L3_9BACT|nr:MAG: hypothetical protein A3F34_00260 [Candidatus Roizmanbacteria bacterium RIFCSPHIGHO2_12_FULL_44_10]